MLYFNNNFWYIVLYYLVLIFNDALFYGVFKESIIQKSNYGRGIFGYYIPEKIFKIFQKPIEWLMKEKPKPQKKFIIEIDCNYRWALQKPLEIGLTILIFHLTNYNWLILIGIVLSNYCLAFDYGYCVLLNQIYLLHQPKQWKPIWLMYPFQIGYWLFKNDGYLYKKYMISAIIGFILLMISTIIKI